MQIKDLHNTLHVYKKNALPSRTAFIPFASKEELLKTDIRTERYHSSKVDCLSGEWEFAYLEKSKSLKEFEDLQALQFCKILVPSTWQNTGFEPPCYLNSRYSFNPIYPNVPDDCPLGVYRKIFQISDGYRKYIISFLGISGSLTLYCNGQFIGYSEGSHNTVEFDLTGFLHDGGNELIVLNHKWCNGSYLESQDMFQCNGIFRDVLLYKCGNNYLHDLDLKTKYIEKGIYNLEIQVDYAVCEQCDVLIEIVDQKKIIAKTEQNILPDTGKAIFKFNMLSVEEWSSETPKLYQCMIYLIQNGKCVEAVRKFIGFRHIEIAGNVFYLNNQPIKLLGVNHHDSNPKTGYVMSVGDMEHDISLIKEFNGNCIRTSHYPPDSIFLDLCDLYGIYVIDEADIETHGCWRDLRKSELCSDSTAWTMHFWDRVYSMYQRDKNHACITMWSLGNESHGTLNQDYCYEHLKMLTDIPIHYEGVSNLPKFAYDVCSHMYTYPELVESIAKGTAEEKYKEKPFFLCEYAHAMGVGPGDLNRYVNAFFSSEQMLGGCIWEFCDHAVWHADGKYEYTYGGDHNEEKHDSNFCVDGLFFPDRTPHAGAYEMKACYRPIYSKQIDENTFLFCSRKYFAETTYDLEYRIIVNGMMCEKESIELTILPQEKKQIRFSLLQAAPDKHCVLQFWYWEKDQLIATEEHELHYGSLAFVKPKGMAPTRQKSEIKEILFFQDGYMVHNSQTGFFESIRFKNTELLQQIPLSDFRGFGIQLFRAPMDNDRNISKEWYDFGLDQIAMRLKDTVQYFSEDNYVRICCEYGLYTPFKGRIAIIGIEYLVFSNGEILISVSCKESVEIPLLPRFGLQFEIPSTFYHVEYYGLGDIVNLVDFREHALTGIFQSEVQMLRENHIKPQDSAFRYNTREVKLTNGNGLGIQIKAINLPFTFSANYYTPQICAKAMHREDLRDMGTICINLDAFLMGVGSNSCGPLPANQNQIGNLEKKEFTVLVSMIGGKEK